jgi:hypothetical protein
MFRNLNKFLKIFKKYSLIDILFLALKKLKLINYNSFIEKRKIELEQEIILLTKKNVIHGLYKGTQLNCKSSWGVGDYSSKLLGFYEVQVQNKIIELQKKYNLKHLINFGSSDGYHLIGLIKNNYFQSAFAYEINDKERFDLKENLYLNNIYDKIKIFGKADFEYIKNNLDNQKLKNTLYLVDIEGEEFNLFNEANLNQFNKSIIIIENHDFFIKNKIKIETFFKLLRENFHLEVLHDCQRNPHNIPEIQEYKDDDKWLMVSEGRICKQDWLICIPKSRYLKTSGI